MSRTTRQVKIKWYAKESALSRRLIQRRRRAAERAALVAERFEDAPIYKGTQGWETH